jgi:predicted nucleic acid-binding protein
VIAYLDTSCLAKLYVEEEGTDRVRAQVNEAESVTTSVIAYPEMRAVLRRWKAQGLLKQPSYQRLLRRFDRDWLGLGRVAVSAAVAEEAGDLSEAHGLRGMDAIHLASALLIRRETGSTDALFLTADKRLADAARGEKFRIPEF